MPPGMYLAAALIAVGIPAAVVLIALLATQRISRFREKRRLQSHVRQGVQYGEPQAPAP